MESNHETDPGQNLADPREGAVWTWGCGSDGRLGHPEAEGHRYLYRWQKLKIFGKDQFVISFQRLKYNFTGQNPKNLEGEDLLRKGRELGQFPECQIVGGIWGSLYKQIEIQYFVSSRKQERVTWGAHQYEKVKKLWTSSLPPSPKHLRTPSYGGLFRRANISSTYPCQMSIGPVVRK